jgi:hypothetical protein
MKITYNNYLEKIGSVDWSKVPAKLQEAKDEMNEFHELYNDDDTIKETFDIFIKQLNEVLAKADVKKVDPKEKIIFKADEYAYLKKDYNSFKKGQQIQLRYDVTENDKKADVRCCGGRVQKAFTIFDLSVLSKTKPKEDIKPTRAVVIDSKKPISKEAFKKKMVKVIDDKLKENKKQSSSTKPKFKHGDRVRFGTKNIYVKDFSNDKGVWIYETSDNEEYTESMLIKGWLKKQSSSTKPKAAPKKQTYKGLKVEIREVPTSYTKGKYFIWDIAKKMMFANEYFKTKSEAKKFITQNGMVLVENKQSSSTKPKPKYKVGDYLYSSSSSKKLGHEFLVKEVIIKDGNVFYKGGYYRGQRKENIILESLFSGKNEGKILTKPKATPKKVETKKKSVKNVSKTYEKSTKSTNKKESPCDEAIENYLENKKASREKAAAKSKRNRVKNALDKENVNFYNAEFRLLRRFKNLITKNKLTFRSVQLLYMAFQKHAIARKVRKTSELAPLYEICNKKLTKLYEAIAPEKADATISIDKDLLEQLTKLVDNKKVDYAISLLNRVINIQGTAPDDKKVERLISSIENAFKNGRVDERSRLHDDLVKAKKELQRYVDDKIEKIPTTNYGLSGVKKKAEPHVVVLNTNEPQPIEVFLNVPTTTHTPVMPIVAPQITPGLNAVENEPVEPEPVLNKVEKVVNTVVNAVKNKNIKKNKNVLSGQELMNMTFDTIKLPGLWDDFMQDPARRMLINITGKPKNGKTSGAMSFANMLTDFGTVLYNFADQGVNSSTQKLWKLSGLQDKSNAFLTANRDIKELDKLCASGDFDYVFIDMINTYIDRFKIKPSEFDDQFKQKYPNISFINIFEVTKGGVFKGDQGWEHLPDQLVNVSDFLMESSGRYGVGHYVVWEDEFKKRNPKKYAELIGEEEEYQEPTEVILNA